ncbi:MAG: helix-turn-helix transcriptional regulator [Exiguobacterium profundum]|nr:MAG: helix-turn-helix transcriptional regulator [Exiguobacterium profundum]
MKPTPNLRWARRRETGALAVFVALQSLAAVFYIGDVFSDIAENADNLHVWFEGTVTLSLVAGILFGIVALRRTFALIEHQDRALEVARGALADVVSVQFKAWGLTPAEADVGLLALKGLDVAEIATLRGAAQGTVRAQLTRIYAKVSVSGRAQFAAHFVEDLMGEGLPERAA